ncbi:MAG: hypothetical protein KAG61_01550 [Bacteriovoracaceae bacterium]|nr:hypothetical protein [Bacteriovoracaceae bacterium]
MAISLGHVKKSITAQIAAAQITKEQSASPWESFDSLGPQIRSVQANEALRKVGVKKNDNLVDFKFYKNKREKVALNGSEIINKVDVPCASAGLIGFLKRLFLS